MPMQHPVNRREWHAAMQGSLKFGAQDRDDAAVLLLCRGSGPQDQLPLFYAASDLVCVPSRYESFGLVAVEAMACGRPVVATMKA